MNEPKRFVAGDTVSWSKSVPEYPPGNGWTLTYSFWNEYRSFRVDAVTDNGIYSIQIPASVSEAIYPGRYSWQAFVSKGSEESLQRHTVGSGEVVVKHNPARTDGKGLDSRSEIKKALDAVNAVIAKTATSDQRSYTIEGRSLERRNNDELIGLRNDLEQKYAQELREERLEQGVGGSKIYVRFRG
jgi:hypothetical protein